MSEKKETAHKRYKDKDKRRKYLQKWYREKRRDAGLCRECGKPAVTRTMCQEHREKRSLDNLYRNYGITKKEYELLGNVCMICGTEKTNTLRMHVDHCHKTKKVRGVLCNNCNNGLGRFKDDTKLLARAITYLNSN